MKNVIGGLIAIILGVFSFTIFFPSFLSFIAGIIPLSLILGGGLVIYLKHEEGAADDWNSNDITDTSSMTVPTKTAPAETKSVEPETVEPEIVEPEIVEKITENPTDDGPKFLGNIGSRVFHNSGCPFSRSKKCTAVFNTREEALGEGYKPCGACKP